MRTVLVTGAAGGIGGALCSVFSAAGYRVVGLDQRPVEAPCEVALTFDIGDVTRVGPVRDELLASIRSAIGDAGLSVLVNNAAVQHLGATEQVTLADWDDTLRINLLAPFVLTQQLLPQLDQARGSVVNIASVHAVATKPEFVCYATSKAALVGLTRALSVDLGPRVRVNAIVPGAISTPMLRAGFEGRETELEELAHIHPVMRIGTPEEIARVALFLGSDDAGFITGASWNIDGGIGGRLHDTV